MATPIDSSKATRIIDIVSQVFGFDEFENILKGLVSKKYRKGLESSEKQFDMNFLPDPKVESMLQDTANTAFRGFSDDMTNKLVRTMQESLAQNESSQLMAKRVKDFFSDKPNPTKFNWKTRLDAILRTETNRAYNRGTAQGAEESGLTGLRKWVKIVDDDRTSNICLAEHAKYGSKEKSIPFDNNFEVTVDNKTFTSPQPPFNINCRSRLMVITRGMYENAIRD